VQPAEKLVMMANQIARNLAVQGEEAAVAGTADHIRRFWDPRMRAAIVRYAANGGALDPIAAAAVRRLAVAGKAEEGKV
jgi:formate dehydrogenase subunit delta